MIFNLTSCTMFDNNHCIHDNGYCTDNECCTVVIILSNNDDYCLKNL